jgi:hypothetical protein
MAPWLAFEPSIGVSRPLHQRGRLEERLPPVVANEVQLPQVILNLVMNAIDAMRSVRPRVLSVTSKLNQSGSVQVSIGSASIHPTSIKSSSPYSRPRNMAWGWGFPSAIRSSRTTTAAFGRRLRPTKARFSNLNCRQNDCRRERSSAASLYFTGTITGLLLSLMRTIRTLSGSVALALRPICGMLGGTCTTSPTP